LVGFVGIVVGSLALEAQKNTYLKIKKRAILGLKWSKLNENMQQPTGNQ
jgi:hypothetical protein